MRSYFFSFLRERLSYWQLADKATAELSAEGRSKLKNGKVTGDRMRRWLSNPLYVGDMPHLGEVYPGQHEAVIDRETFDAVQRRIANAPPRPKCDDDAEIIYAPTGRYFSAHGVEAILRGWEVADAAKRREVIMATVDRCYVAEKP